MASSMDIEVPTPMLRRAEGLRFDDCGLILQAETTIFRISREFFGIHSPVFRGMLSLPTPKDADIMDGCPFVLLPDSAEDVTYFLKALLFFEPRPAPVTYSVLAGILRMRHKYEVDALRKRALIYLSHFHPTTLIGWEELDDNSHFGFLGEEDEEQGLRPISIILLARQLSIDWILLIAFYRVCELTYESLIIKGYDTVELSTDDKVNCMIACRLLETTAVTQMLDFLWSPPRVDGCISRRVCADARLACRRTEEKKRERTSDGAATMPLDIWRKGAQRKLEICCEVCLSAMKIAHQDAEQSL
ncbi:hypothetical protein FB451DRAFT_1407393 [Mycena latifolia]|nr:hypothetical protein FB451DRAFT_1407393 [Mycena latifolia]